MAFTTLRGFYRKLQGTDPVIERRDQPRPLNPAQGALPKPPRRVAVVVRLRNIIFPERVDLSEVVFADTVVFENCKFEKGIWLRDARFEKRLAFIECEFQDDEIPWLDWRRLHVAGDLDLSGSTSHLPIDLYNAVLGHDLRLDGLHVTACGKPKDEILKDTNLQERLTRQQRHHLATEIPQKAINLAGAAIRRNIFVDPWTQDNNDSETVRRTDLQGMIDLRAHVGRAVVFVNAIVDAGENRTAVALTSADVKGAVLFHDGTEITGKIDLRANVGRVVVFVKATVNAGENRTAVDLYGADVKGSVHFVGDTKITGRIYLHEVLITKQLLAPRMRLAGSLEIMGSFIGPEKHDDDRNAEGGDNTPTQARSVVLNLARIGGDLLVQQDTIIGMNAEGCEVHGKASFTGTVIEGDLILRSAEVEDYAFGDEEGGDACPQVTGRVDARYAKLQQAYVRIEAGENEQNATIPRELDFSGAEIRELSIFGQLNSDPNARPELKFDGIRFDRLILSKDKKELEVSRSVRCRAVVNCCVAWWLATVVMVVRFMSWLLIERPSFTEADRLIQWRLLGWGCWLFPLVVAAAVTQRAGIGWWHGHRDGQNNPLPPGWSWRDVVRFWTWLALVTEIGLRLSAIARPWLGYALLAGYVAYTTIKIRRRNPWRQILRLKDRQDGGQVVDPADRYIGLLRRAVFSRRFYIEVEEMFRREGDDRSADEVFLARRKIEPREARSAGAGANETLGAGWWHNLQDLVTGFGVRVHRMVHLFVLLWGLNAAIFAEPTSVQQPLQLVTVASSGAVRGDRHAVEERDRMAERRAEAATGTTETNSAATGGSATPAGRHPPPDEWTLLDGFFVAARLQIPFLPLVVETYWEPAPTEISFIGFGFTYRYWAVTMVVINMILVPLVVAGIRSKLKRDAV